MFLIARRLFVIYCVGFSVFYLLFTMLLDCGIELYDTWPMQIRGYIDTLRSGFQLLQVDASVASTASVCYRRCGVG